MKLRYYIITLTAFILIFSSHPCALFMMFSSSLRATLYLDTVDQDEDLFIYQNKKNADSFPIHQEESKKESGQKAKSMKRKISFFCIPSFKLSERPIAIELIPPHNLVAIEPFAFHIFHPPNTPA